MPRAMQNSWDQIRGTPQALYDYQSLMAPLPYERHAAAPLQPAQFRPGYWIPPVYDTRPVGYITPTKQDWYHPYGTISWRPRQTPRPTYTPRVVPAPYPQRALYCSRTHYTPVTPPSYPMYHSKVPSVRHKRHCAYTEGPTIHPLLSRKCGRTNLMFDLSKPPADAHIRKFGREQPLPVDRKPIIKISSCHPHSESHMVSFEHELLEDHALDVTDMMLEDFLWALYDYFQQPLTWDEDRKLRRSRRKCIKAMKAMTKRYVDTWDPDREWEEGFKRIDLLEQTWLKEVYVENDEEILLRVSFMENDQ